MEKNFMKRFFLLIGLIGLFVFLVACNNDEENSSDANDEEERVTVVETNTVDEGDLLVERVIYGNMSPASQQPVMIEQPGEVEELFVENGEKVEKDDEIATIKSPMGKRKIKAPMDGTISKLDAKEETMVSNEEPLAIVIDLDELEANFSVTKSVRDLFEKDQKVNIEIENEKYEGKILAMDILPNDQGQFSIVAKVESEGNFLPGAVAKLTIKETKVADTLLVPTKAIIMESEDAFVFVVEDDVAKKVTIEITETQTDLTAVTGELVEGDEVITNGQFTLSDGSKVEVVKEGNES